MSHVSIECLHCSELGVAFDTKRNEMELSPEVIKQTSHYALEHIKSLQVRGWGEFCDTRHFSIPPLKDAHARVEINLHYYQANYLLIVALLLVRNPLVVFYALPSSSSAF